MIQKKSEDAVSPVIGVMLLLVVTIVIAAVVAVFASGVGVDTEPAPVTVVDITNIALNDTSWEQEVTLYCSHGESLDLSKISIEITQMNKDDMDRETGKKGVERIVKTPRGLITGLFNPGDYITFKWDPFDSNLEFYKNGRETDPDVEIMYETVVDSVVVYYGDYRIAEREKMTVMMTM